MIGTGGFSIGLELPLDNDWSTAGQQLREKQGRPFGVPDMRRHGELARQADESGFSALWVRDVPHMTLGLVTRPRCSRYSHTSDTWRVSLAMSCWGRQQWCCRFASPG